MGLLSKILIEELLWRKALAQTVRDKKNQIKIYHGLSILFSVKDEAKFRATL